MKKTALILGLLLTFSFGVMAEPSQADQKWLGVVKSMVAEGKTTITTPAQARVDLVKDWGTKAGYSVTVVKTDVGYSIQLTRKAEVALNK